MSMQTLEDYKKDIKGLNRQLTETILADENEWAGSPFLFGEEIKLTPSERKEKEIERLKRMKQKALACAGELALYGVEDNMGYGY
jgi:hypothetical protein